MNKQEIVEQKIRDLESLCEFVETLMKPDATLIFPQTPSFGIISSDLKKPWFHDFYFSTGVNKKLSLRLLDEVPQIMKRLLVEQYEDLCRTEEFDKIGGPRMHSIYVRVPSAILSLNRLSEMGQS